MSDTQAAMREFRFLDEKRKTNGLTEAEESRWQELGAALGIDLSASLQPAGYYGADGLWYQYPPGYDPNAAWQQAQQPQYPQGYAQPGYYPPQPQGYYDPNTGAYYPPQPQYPQGYAAPQPGYYDPNTGAYYPPEMYAQPQQPAYDPNQAAWGYPQQPVEQQQWPQPSTPTYAPPVPEPIVQQPAPQPEPLAAVEEVGTDDVMEISDEEVMDVPVTAPPAPTAKPAPSLQLDSVEDLQKALLDDSPVPRSSPSDEFKFDLPVDDAPSSVEQINQAAARVASTPFAAPQLTEVVRDPVPSMPSFSIDEDVPEAPAPLAAEPSFSVEPVPAAAEVVANIAAPQPSFDLNAPVEVAAEPSFSLELPAEPAEASAPSFALEVPPTPSVEVAPAFAAPLEAVPSFAVDVSSVEIEPSFDAPVEVAPSFATNVPSVEVAPSLSADVPPVEVAPSFDAPVEAAPSFAVDVPSVEVASSFDAPVEVAPSFAVDVPSVEVAPSLSADVPPVEVAPSFDAPVEAAPSFAVVEVAPSFDAPVEVAPSFAVDVPSVEVAPSFSGDVPSAEVAPSFDAQVEVAPSFAVDVPSVEVAPSLSGDVPSAEVAPSLGAPVEVAPSFAVDIAPEPSVEAAPSFELSPPVAEPPASSLEIEPAHPLQAADPEPLPTRSSFALAPELPERNAERPSPPAPSFVVQAEPGAPVSRSSFAVAEPGYQSGNSGISLPPEATPIPLQSAPEPVFTEPPRPTVFSTQKFFADPGAALPKPPVEVATPEWSAPATTAWDTAPEESPLLEGEVMPEVEGEVVVERLPPVPPPGSSTSAFDLLAMPPESAPRIPTFAAAPAPAPLADKSAFGTAWNNDAPDDFSGNTAEAVELASNADFLSSVAPPSAPSDTESIDVDAGEFIVESASAAELATDVRERGASSVDDGKLELASNHDFIDNSQLTQTGERWSNERTSIPLDEEDDGEVIQGTVLEEEEPAPVESWGAAVAPTAPPPPPARAQSISNLPAVPPPPPARAQSLSNLPAVPPPPPPAQPRASTIPSLPVVPAPAAPTGELATVFLPGEHRVILHTMEGQVKRGAIRDAQLGGSTLQLMLANGGGETLGRERVKALFFMLAPGSRAPATEGNKVRVTFKDGRQVAGFSKDHKASAAGFFVVPADNRTNTERIFIFRHAVQSITVEG